jgi:nephrocystin-3
MNASSRTVRVFLSSTFRDFAEERDLLVRKVFPELRRKCRQRQVELVDVDLRWGITEKEAQQGKVLPICLAEVDRSRPFFMGFLGERYGWVPEKDQYDLSLILEQPWLDEHRGGKSVTELEMLHGVLNNPAMEDRAFFYFRDAAYSRKKGGAYLSEGPAERAKLEALKDRIRTSRFPVVEDYKKPEDLAERVKEDLWKLIDEAFPESEVPDALTQERLRHEAYGATRRRLYFAGEDYFQTLDAAMKAKRFQPVLITGQSGAGKSALLANWMTRWSENHPKTETIMHHLGCGADAANPVRMVTRLMQEIERLTGEKFKPETSVKKTLEQLPEALALASAWAQRNKRSLLIVLDGLDKLSGEQHLRWVPDCLPPKVKLVVSGLEGAVMESARRRLEWIELTVKPFTRGEQTRFIKEYLGRFRKPLTGPQRKTLQAHPLCGNPLFLLTVLEELRIFGVHKELEKRLSTLLSPPPNKAKDEPPTVDDVFEHVLERIEVDLGKKAVRSAMEAIWASRRGLYIDEILAIAKLTPSRLAAILIALNESLYENGGKICFGNHYLRKAVEDRYIATPRRATAIHGKLGDFFGSLIKNKNGSEERGYMEVVYHLIEASRLQDAEEIFCDFSYLIKKLMVREEEINDSAALDSLLVDCLKLQSIKPALSPRLTYWVDFISSNAHVLQRGNAAWPAYKILLQVAAEDFENSPVSQAADSWLDTGECNWLWLRRADRPAPNFPHMAKPKVFETKVVGAVQTGPASLLSWDLEEMKLWDIRSGKYLTVSCAPKSGFMSHESKEFIAVFEDGVAWIDPMRGEPLTYLKYEGGKLDGGILLVSGDVLTWCDKDKEAQIWTRSGLAGSWKELWMPMTSLCEDLEDFRGYLLMKIGCFFGGTSLDWCGSGTWPKDVSSSRHPSMSLLPTNGQHFQSRSWDREIWFPTNFSMMEQRSDYGNLIISALSVNT